MSAAKVTQLNNVEWMAVRTTNFETECWIDFLANFGITENNYFDFVKIWRDFGMEGKRINITFLYLKSNKNVGKNRLLNWWIITEAL